MSEVGLLPLEALLGEDSCLPNYHFNYASRLRYEMEVPLQLTRALTIPFIIIGVALTTQKNFDLLHISRPTQGWRTVCNLLSKWKTDTSFNLNKQQGPSANQQPNTNDITGPYKGIHQ
jgi:hypothetical protein